MVLLFEHRDNLGHDEHCLADVGVPGPLHPYRGLGDVVQEAAHLVDDGSFVRCQLPPRALGVLPKYSLIGFFKARRRSIILNWLVHLFVGSCFARGTIVGGGRGGGRGGRGRRCRFFILYIFIYYAMEIERGQMDTKRKHY